MANFRVELWKVEEVDSGSGLYSFLDFWPIQTSVDLRAKVTNGPFKTAIKRSINSVLFNFAMGL